ncbi:hypothetical protein PM082_018285 [Marasmius tenuissimus]|nr:hypothetical protein PM082_018285 [Marasmius tenuissimus]
MDVRNIRHACKVDHHDIGVLRLEARVLQAAANSSLELSDIDHEDKSLSRLYLVALDDGDNAPLDSLDDLISQTSPTVAAINMSNDDGLRVILTNEHRTIRQGSGAAQHIFSTTDPNRVWISSADKEPLQLVGCEVLYRQQNDSWRSLLYNVSPALFPLLLSSITIESTSTIFRPGWDTPPPLRSCAPQLGYREISLETRRKLSPWRIRDTGTRDWILGLGRSRTGIVSFNDLSRLGGVKYKDHIPSVLNTHPRHIDPALPAVLPRLEVPA